ncbi:MAG: substrate-binding domain-containing protein [Longimicrobiales bacterium]|nr:substrate-binding domain-containing protein [Longimicrobiales bacterium]
MPIHNALAAERERLGWTQAEAGEAGGISRQSYAAIESGTSVPSTEVALRLARAMGRSVEELFRLPETPSEKVTAVWGGDGAALDRRVRLVRVAGRRVAVPQGEEERPSRSADGVVTHEAHGSVHPDETRVRVRLLHDRPPPADLAVMGCDPAFGIVAEALRRDRGVNVVWSARGSRAALQALAAGRAHVAGAHLQDPETGESNGPWIRELVPFPCTRIRFAVWEEGLLVRSGNPEAIGGVTDLVRPGIRLVNREPGSGSRLLLDEVLASAGVPADRIQGYDTAAAGHLAVGEAIAAGLADVGVGIRAAGAAFGLDVLPLRTEPYELIVPDHFLDLLAVQALLDALRLPGIRTQVEALQGYDGSGMGEAV